MNMNRKHVLIMLSCCLIPLAAFAAIVILRLPLNSVVYIGLLLLCPALHLLMMRSMLGHDHDVHNHEQHDITARPSQQEVVVIDRRN